jgi:hypothetical protein
MYLRDWLITVASALNDAEPGREFHRYPLRDYVAAYNAAMSLIAKHRAEDFLDLVKVKLRPGKHQDARQCCSHVVGIVDQIDDKGNIIKQLSASSKRVKNRWRKPSCVTSATGAVVSPYYMIATTIDTQLNGQFTVEPPVPCDVPVYVLVKCVKKTGNITEAQLSTLQIDESSFMFTAAWHYMLARMLSGDRHAGSADGTSAMHYKLFFDMLGVVMRQEDLLENPK